ncbi:hypothetical protein TYRP_013506 [Tyrophagus putrescentiae]|nr:hypothetical protein TYRP_013506 [Tyrophagus putrescentiae]
MSIAFFTKIFKHNGTHIAMPPSYDTDVVTVVFRKLRSLLMAAQSSENHMYQHKIVLHEILNNPY